MVNKKSAGFATWYYLSALYFFANGYLFYLYFVVQNNAASIPFKCKVGSFNLGLSSTDGFLTTQRNLRKMLRMIFRKKRNAFHASE